VSSARVTRVFAVATALAGVACGSGSDGGGSSNVANERCALDITVTGDANLELDFDDSISCLTAYTTTPGAYVGFGPAPVDEVAIVTLSFPELEPGETASSLAVPLAIHHADRTQFSPMGCVVDVTENAFDETVEGGDVYRVSGRGSCSTPGTNGARSVAVLGSFRFVAPIRWQN